MRHPGGWRRPWRCWPSPGRTAVGRDTRHQRADPDGRALSAPWLRATPRYPAPRPAPVQASWISESRLRSGSAGIAVAPQWRSRQRFLSHQIYSFSAAKRSSCPCTAASRTRRCSRSTGVITLAANIHDDMLAYLLVTDAPYFGARMPGRLSVDVPARPLPSQHLAPATARE